MTDTRKPRSARPRTAAEPWDVKTLPVLPGYISLEEAARRRNTSKEAVHRLVKRGTLKAWRVGEETKPMILVKIKDVEELPVSPQQRAKLAAAGELPDDPELGDELPGT